MTECSTCRKTETFSTQTSTRWLATIVRDPLTPRRAQPRDRPVHHRARVVRRLNWVLSVAEDRDVEHPVRGAEVIHPHRGARTPGAVRGGRMTAVTNTTAPAVGIGPFSRSDLIVLIGALVLTVGAGVTAFVPSGQVVPFVLSAGAVALLASVVGRSSRFRRPSPDW